MGLAIVFGLFALGLAVGAPVAFAVGLAAVGGFLYEGLPLFVAFQRILSGISVFSLLAIPFFIFAGELMLHGGISQRLVRLASAAVGRVRGGLGVVNVTSSMLFGGISGSAVADTSALGSILIPVMKEKGYDADYAVNVTVTSSVAGVVIPPSHNMILYAVAAGGGLSITKLFMAGIVPGILMCGLLALAAYLVAVKRGYQGEHFPGWQALAISFAAALPGLLTAVIIVGGVLSGVLTVTESGAFGAIYAIVVTALVYRELHWASFKQAVYQSVRTTALVMILVGCASAFSYLLALYSVPELLSNTLLGITDNPLAILLMLNLILLALGMIMDMAALILICTPIFLPIAAQFGMDPIQFGIMMMMNLGLGLCTPPVGACLFVGSVVGKIKIEQTVRTIWPFYLALFAALMLVTYVPALSMALPNMLE
ncbi:MULTISPECIES: TRAP transporter large permease [unclassified Halomonas]|uniref:TRAP transporter large permease n=1 Tax=unclassified Halomonas TaxID=2609666 RepID=UPI0005FA0A81|nr:MULTISPECIES: TRAP transporter large permease [unclassified Halomonas]KJZ16834.1 C4-dicarboxylate ABC transporter permease [Halomonas sp. S2151]MCJ8286093.1 TRAP transporter large permease [Halomonas sp.]MCO7215947.1 TRAP transporter large permease [Halomonas sp. OfavH-34-E]NQY71145.1 TRAP transporter large permease [Halomonas sp.]RQW70019.1 TRAP transporter large permease [Halomonas sp. YLB-10]